MKIPGSMTAWLILIIGALLVIGIMIPRYFIDREDIPDAPPVASSPFHSIVVRDGAIVATLRPRPTWHVHEGTMEPRLSKPEESFTMQAGSVIRLTEHHASYQVTAQILPNAGLMIESSFDARSFGDGVTKNKFFVAAK